MSTPLPEAAKAVVDGRNFATLATVNPDGGPQSSVVWITRDGEDLLMSTVIGRRKEKNLRRDPRVSVSIFDIEQPYRYLEVRGSVTMTEEGGGELINTLSRKYKDRDYTADGPTDTRVVIRLTPDKVTGTIG